MENEKDFEEFEDLDNLEELYNIEIKDEEIQDLNDVIPFEEEKQQPTSQAAQNIIPAVDVLQGLNPQQKQAVLARGAVLCLAGAGSGKTKVLTQRIMHLITNDNAKPSKILAITFTNKAAEEMKQRVINNIGQEGENIPISTFHSFCAKILRSEISNLQGYSGNFTIYDVSDCRSIVKRGLIARNSDIEPLKVLAYISKAKEQGISPQEYLNTFGNTGNLAFHTKIQELYNEYQNELNANNALDFDDLLYLTCRLLKENPQVLDKVQDYFDYILLDEYQDTNSIQYELSKMLADKHKEIFAVGDINQSIYGWRGADIKNIMAFDKDYPNAQTIRLEQNYRSVQNILDVANNVISKNPGNSNIHLWSNLGIGDKIIRYEATNEYKEAEYITKQIKFLSKKYKFDDIAVLYRTNLQAHIFEAIFLENNIPFRTIGGTQFYERKEIKDILAYMKLLANPCDNLSFERIINVPKRGIGPQTIEKLRQYANSLNVSLVEASSRGQEIDFPIKGIKKNAVDNLITVLYDLIGLVDTIPLKDLTNKILDITGYSKELQQNIEESEGRLENLNELLAITAEYDRNNPNGSLIDFLTNSALVTAMDEENTGTGEAVTLMTLHGSKGLEFPVVFLAGAEEGILPLSEDEIEEERRLFYVGITRAQQKLYITNATHRISAGFKMSPRKKNEEPPNINPSPFLDDIPQSLIFNHKY